MRSAAKMAEQPSPARHEKFERLVAQAQSFPEVPTAGVHPCDDVSLKGAVEAARLKLISPVLVGPAARVREVAAKSKLDIAGLEIVDSAHSHDSAVKAVELVRADRQP